MKINLDPLDKWHDKEEYKSAAKKLNQLSKTRKGTHCFCSGIFI